MNDFFQSNSWLFLAFLYKHVISDQERHTAKYENVLLSYTWGGIKYVWSAPMHKLFAFILRSSHWGLPTREEFESISVLLPSDTWSIIGCCCCVKLFSLPYVSQKVFLQHPQTAWCKGHNLTFPVPYTSSSVYLLRIFYTLGG